jgi:hypothetical protein
MPPRELHHALVRIESAFDFPILKPEHVAMRPTLASMPTSRMCLARSRSSVEQRVDCKRDAAGN